MSGRSKNVTFTLGQSNNEKLIVACTKCTRETNHRVCTSIEERGSEPLGDQITFEWHEDYQVIQCLGCDTVSFRILSSNSEDYDDFDSILREKLYPSRTNNWRLLEGLHFMPVSLQQIYQETVLALNNDQPVLSSIGIRAIVETVSRQEQATGNNLKQRIDGLVGKGKLTPDGAAILHRIRDLGNDSAHESKAPTGNELKLAMKVVEHLLESVYILPAHAQGTFGTPGIPPSPF